jgi:hypothetical protein
MNGPVEAPNPGLARDAEVLVGLLALLEGELLAGELSAHLVEKIRDRFARVGLPTPTAELSHAIHDLNQRLRHTLGEYD